MPKANKFLKGFDLVKNRKFDGFEIIKISSTHETIVRYHKYQYHIKMVVKKIENDTIENLIKNINKNNYDREILSEYGNPYLCKIKKISKKDIHKAENDTYYILMLGNSLRVYK